MLLLIAVKIVGSVSVSDCHELFLPVARENSLVGHHGLPRRRYLNSTSTSTSRVSLRKRMAGHQTCPASDVAETPNGASTVDLLNFRGSFQAALFGSTPYLAQRVLGLPCQRVLSVASLKPFGSLQQCFSQYIS